MHVDKLLKLYKTQYDKYKNDNNVYNCAGNIFIIEFMKNVMLREHIINIWWGFDREINYTV